MDEDELEAVIHEILHLQFKEALFKVRSYHDLCHRYLTLSLQL